MTHFQSVFMALPEAVVLTDLERRIVMVNPGLESMFGYQEEELLGKTAYILYASKE